MFFPSLMGMIGFWSTLSLNIPDFTRFGGSQRAQLWGQTLGLPTTMTLFAVLSVLVTSGSQAVYGEPIWDPIALSAKMSNVVGALFALLIVMVATLSVNIAANVVSPAYDLSNLVPKYVNFRTGALITGVVGIVILPWKLIANPHVYIFTWLGVVGGLLGTVAGILIADYWFLRRTRLALADLYRRDGRYWYTGGWNLRAVLAFAVGGVLAIGGSYSTVVKGVKQGPFPADGVIRSSSRWPTTAGPSAWPPRSSSTPSSARGGGRPADALSPPLRPLGRPASPSGRPRCFRPPELLTELNSSPVGCGHGTA
ncbi:cytosine permease [Streptacidiphilus monticola]